MNTVSPSILYEDVDCMVINKPAGLVVNRARSVQGETVQDWSEKKLGIILTKNPSELEQLFFDRSGVVHRLDKETSGILLVAKHPDALENLLAQFKNRIVKKEYMTLVHGDVIPTEGTVQAPIGRLAWRHGLFGVMPGGKPAVTHYTVIQHFTRDKQKYSLLSVRIETGRTHQIRVHLQYSGYPVVGDLFYGGRKTSRKDRMWCPRLFLHASKLIFKQPTSGEWITVTSELPNELTEIISKFLIPNF